jgi:hypothetical protein
VDAASGVAAAGADSAAAGSAVAGDGSLHVSTLLVCGTRLSRSPRARAGDFRRTFLVGALAAATWTGLAFGGLPLRAATRSPPPKGGKDRCTGTLERLAIEQRGELRGELLDDAFDFRHGVRRVTE